MALSVKLSSYISGGYTGHAVRWDLIETGTGVLIDSHTEPGPHGQVYNFSFVNNIIDVVYTVKLYDVPPGAGLGNLIKSHDLTVSTSTLIIDADIEMIVGGALATDAVAGDDNFTNPALIDKDFYIVQRGIGQLLYARLPEYSFDNATGKVTLIVGTFNDEDIFILKMRPKYVVNPPGSQSASGIFKDVVIITADTTLVGADFGKLLVVEAIANVITITMPLINTIIKKVPLWIESVGTRLDEDDTNHINVILQAAEGDTIKGIGRIAGRFILSRGEKAQLIRIGDVMYFFTDSNDIKRVGQLEFSYGDMLNRLWADGSEVLVADYPRLKDALDLMQVGTVVSYAAYDAVTVVDGVNKYINRGKFALSNDGTKIKVPDWRNMSVRFNRYSDNTADAQRLTQGVGGFQLGANAPHSHFVANSHKDTTSTALTNLNYLCYEGDVGPGDFKYILFGSGDVPNKGKTSDGGGVEARSENYSQIPVIII